MSEKKILSLHGRPGNETFMTCSCSKNESLFTPVILHDQQGPIVVSLMCPECEATVPVVNGIVQMTPRPCDLPSFTAPGFEFNPPEDDQENDNETD